MTTENTKEPADNNIEEMLFEEKVLDESQEVDSEEKTKDESNVDGEPSEEAPEIGGFEKLLEESNNKYLRLVAEFENFRRRTAKENLDLIESANNRLIGSLTDVLENFERAFDQKIEEAKVEDFHQGVRLIRDQFKGILNQAGLEEINPVNAAFDPNLHEALMQQPSDEVPADHVVTVFQKGFKIKNKVIKHAKVIVSTGPAA